MEGSPRTVTPKTAFEGAIDSMAKSGPCVGSDDPLSNFVTKEEFTIFATKLFSKLDELKGSIPAPVSAPNPIAEALKANTDEVNALKVEVADLKASATTK